MPKSITINYSHVKGEFLVQFFKDNKLVKWELANGSVEVQKLIVDFYFPDKS